jgi:DNA replication and repair protein RecF
VVRQRLAWVTATAPRFVAECATMGETMRPTLRYRGNPDLADPGAWSAALEAAAEREAARGMSLIGPQRDDLVLELDGHLLREFGSTGQQRTAAIALKLCELTTLGEMRGTEPVLLLDDVFAELDRDRQERLAHRLGGPGVRQVFVTAPRRDELPPALELPVFEVREGRVRSEE